MFTRSRFSLFWHNHTLQLGARTLIMGVVNITPDSFSDGGLFFSRDAAVNHGLELYQQGADIIDVGGESTRPFSDSVDEEEELRRVIPVIEALAKKVPVPISIDTTKGGVAQRAIDAGASIINDVSALRNDAGMGSVAAATGVPLVLMHMLGTPKTMQVRPEYDDVVNDIKEFLGKAVSRALDCGIAADKLIVDPGIGFGKTIDHNLAVLKRLPELSSLDLPILIGPSRKAFIRSLLKEEMNTEILPRMPAAEIGTQAAVCTAALNGAHIVRVHDVRNTRAALAIVDAIAGA